MHRTQRKSGLQKQSVAVLLLLVFCLCTAVQVQAAGVISGRYITKTDTELTLAIQIGSPAPVTLIIIQHLPPGAVPSSAKPAYKKYNKKKGEVRWLLRNVETGTLQVTLRLKKPAPTAQVHAEIRCMDPATGKLIKTVVK